MLRVSYLCVVLIFMLLCPVFAQDFLEQESKIRAKAGQRKVWPIISAAKRMVEEELTPQDENQSEAVLDALMRVPRDRFVPAAHRNLAYRDTAVPIGNAQTISSPSTVAFMLEKLDLQPEDKILEIGTGTGYEAAVLSLLVKEVYTIEIVEPLGKRAAQTLKKIGYKNIHTKIGDGFHGWSEAAPFDKIIVTCSPESIPQPLLEQLKDGGKMIIPVGERYQQVFQLVRKKGTEFEKTLLTPTLFAPMSGEAEKLRNVQPNTKAPTIVGGDFEEALQNTLESTSENIFQSGPPVGWHDTKNAKLLDDLNAPQGARFLRLEVAADPPTFDDMVSMIRDAEDIPLRVRRQMLQQLHRQSILYENINLSGDTETKTKINSRPEPKRAQIVQGFAVDGKYVSKINIAMILRGRDISHVERNRQKPNGIVFVQFYNEERNMIQSLELANAAGSFDWEKYAIDIPVPKKTKEAILLLGLFDTTGILDIDAISVKKVK